ncbi:hypothetical protein FHP25_34140 [Vineibacter terrae]|uniref:Uncharacterized protein n=1 Tax=Vineibacter terrae TaxID=2586908 RepID=A0A5C8PAK2_9HYPH|nr:hypothetical protein [Vineibacter terrae]TXL70577.1 hypothetical protein FHP25_34140 [Vineibacter terrae]
MAAAEPDRLPALRQAMHRIADAVAALPEAHRDLAGNALLNVAVETLVDEVGTSQAARLLRRVAALVDHGVQPPESGAINLARCDA